MKTIPNSLQSKLWSADLDKLNLQKDKVYIIHQVLRYGNLNEIKWLFDIYGKQTVADVFLTHPQKIYSKACLNFTKHLLLNTKKPLEDQKYLQSLYQCS